MTWILAVWFFYERNAVAFQEFNTREACYEARAIMIKEADSRGFHAVCVAKGRSDGR